MRILAQRFELPQQADALEMADAPAVAVQDAGQLLVQAVQGQRLAQVCDSSGLRCCAGEMRWGID